MPEIILENVTKRFGKSTAVDNLSLEIKDRAFVSLLGPSGCGKTTILRMVTGLETPTEGNIYIDGQMVFSAKKGVNISPAKRGVGFLFQNYALWPHMTVYQNIGFGLENLKWSKDKVRSRVEELTKTLKIGEYLDRYPGELSGGQQQRVAIARTLATGSKILFMDEPLSNLDAKLRNEMRVELKRLHDETDSTFVYVTHDQLEAMTLSSRICLLNLGILQQYAPPLELYNEPENVFVADFVGNPTSNFVETEVEKTDGEGIFLRAKNLRFRFVPRKNPAGLSSGDKVILGIRPEFVKVDDKSPLEGRVYSTLPSGMETIVKIDVSHINLTAVIFGDVDYKMNQEIRADIITNKVVLFHGESKEKLAIGELNFLTQ